MKISIIGGDTRNVELSKILKKNNDVLLYGFEIYDNIDETNLMNLDEIIENSDIIITPIPLSKNQKDFNAPFARDIIKIEEFMCKCHKKIIITGNINTEYFKELEKNENKVYDIIKLEEYAILNAEPTAEGAIQVAMENTKRVLQGSNVLVVGYGKIGKILSNKLKFLDCNVYCSARKEFDFATMKANYIKQVNYDNFENYIKNMDIIFNTVPNILFEEKELKNIKKDAIVIDLASKPGGVNLKKASELGIKVINAQGLPGKVAPITAAEYIAQIIEKIVIKT